MAWDRELGEWVDDGEHWDEGDQSRVSGHLYSAFLFGNQSESPIEATLAWELVKRETGEYIVRAQHEWGGWRIDLVILDRNNKPVAFIECDGRKFHERELQIANDRRKDAAAAGAGIKMFRFTGSEIFNDPKACAAQVWAGIKK